MEAYRLYTILPRLLELIDELTNWYIRFNRRRLKGEDGKEDTIAALNTLFETLFTLCRTMVRVLREHTMPVHADVSVTVLVHSFLDREPLPDAA
jgi:isoleucyl-tRNA synthetase